MIEANVEDTEAQFQTHPGAVGLITHTRARTCTHTHSYRKLEGKHLQPNPHLNNFHLQEAVEYRDSQSIFTGGLA